MCIKMSSSNVEYDNLKKRIIKELGESFDLEKIKQGLSVCIQSRRSLSRVRNLNDIFHLLEERDILDYNNVSVLEYVANILQNSDIIKLIRGYKKLILNLDYIDSDYIVCQCGLDITFIPPVVNSQENQDKTKSDDSELWDAFNNIAVNIGKNWRVLSSELKIPERYVDAVRKKYPSDFYQQALNILRIWKEYNNEAATMDELKKALEARLCKRKGIGLHMLKPVISV